MRKIPLCVGIAILGVVTAAAAPGQGSEQPEITTAGQVADAIAIEDLAVRDGAVTGTLVNQTGRMIREVKLLVRYTWLWNNERAPQRDNPGRSYYTTVTGEIPPHGKLAFAYRPDPPLAKRTDGRFQPSVQVVGFTEVGD